jgi:ParB-like chromosome segregation protein Spo0J
MDAFTYSKVIDSLLEYGFIDPITVRPHPVMRATGKGPMWQIIDGENRWKGALDLGMKNGPGFNLGTIDDTQAMKLTIVLNELRGQYDPREMSALLAKLMESEDPIELAKSLPFTEIALKGMIGLDDLQLEGSSIPMALQRGEALQKQRQNWVERLFRLTVEANGVLQSALDKAKDGEDISDAQALELVAADFLSGD